MCQNHKLFNFVKPKKSLYNSIGKHLIWKDQNIFFLLLVDYATNKSWTHDATLQPIVMGRRKCELGYIAHWQIKTSYTEIHAILQNLLDLQCLKTQ